MKLFRSILILAGICAPLGCVFSAPAPAPTPAKGFDAFRILRTRNIFDPQRNPLSPVAAPQPRYVSEGPRRSVDSVTLTGIMVTGGKALAFFSGSQSDDNKVIGVNGEIAGGKITKITPIGIEVDRDGKKISLTVGQMVSFDSSAPGAAQVTDSAPAPLSAPAAASPAAGDLPQPASSPLPGNLNEVMRRMMERRQQQIQ